MSLVEKELAKFNIVLSNKELNKFRSYHSLYLKYVKSSDLSRIYDFKSIVKKHYVDSLLVNKYHKFITNDIVMDIGTGAGFPGIPLAITNPDTLFILAEPRPKRVAFLKLVKKELSMDNISVLPQKIVKGISLKKTPNIVITRALEDIAYTLERVKDFLLPNAQVIFMKGPNYKEDLKRAEQLSYIFKLKSVFPYQLSKQDKRTLIIYSKIEF